MTSSNGNIFRVTGHLCGEFTGPRWIPHTKASDAELWCFFYLRLNKRLSKQSWGWWLETLSRPLWRHRNKKPTSGQCSGLWRHKFNMFKKLFNSYFPHLRWILSKQSIINAMFTLSPMYIRRWSCVLDTYQCLTINTFRPRKMDAIFQTAFSNAFSSMKMYEFLVKFHWSLFLGIRLTIFHYWFR